MTEAPNRTCQEAETVSARSGAGPSLPDEEAPCALGGHEFSHDAFEVLGRFRLPATDRDGLVGESVGRLRTERIELRSPSGPCQRQRGLDRHECRRELGVRTLTENGQPAVGGTVEFPLLEIQVAQAIRRIIADGGQEVGRIEPLERGLLCRSLGLVQEFLCVGVVEEPIRRLSLGREPGEHRAPLVGHRNDETIRPVHEPGRLCLGDGVECLRRPLPCPPPREPLEVVEGFLRLARSRGHLQWPIRPIVRQFLGVGLVGPSRSAQHRDDHYHDGYANHDGIDPMVTLANRICPPPVPDGRYL